MIYGRGNMAVEITIGAFGRAERPVYIKTETVISHGGL